MQAPAFIRPCFEQDLEMVSLLAAHHALTGFSMLEEQALTLPAWGQRWSRIVQAGRPFFVACPQADPSRVIAYAYADTPLLGASQLDPAGLELFGAVTPALLRHGVGGEMLRQLLEDLKTSQAEQVYACHGSFKDSGASSPAILLLRRGGFGLVGKLPGAARKFGRAIDVIVMARAL